MNPISEKLNNDVFLLIISFVKDVHSILCLRLTCKKIERYLSEKNLIPPHISAQIEECNFDCDAAEKDPHYFFSKKGVKGWPEYHNWVPFFPGYVSNISFIGDNYYVSIARLSDGKIYKHDFSCIRRCRKLDIGENRINDDRIITWDVDTMSEPAIAFFEIGTYHIFYFKFTSSWEKHYVEKKESNNISLLYTQDGVIGVRLGSLSFNRDNISTLNGGKMIRENAACHNHRIFYTNGNPYLFYLKQNNWGMPKLVCISLMNNFYYTITSMERGNRYGIERTKHEIAIVIDHLIIYFIPFKQIELFIQGKIETVQQEKVVFESYGSWPRYGRTVRRSWDPPHYYRRK